MLSILLVSGAKVGNTGKASGPTRKMIELHELIMCTPDEVIIPLVSIDHRNLSVLPDEAC